MNFDERVAAVADLGFTERQARFLTTVMLHAGVCVPRQYARFAGVAYGHTVNRFFDKLVERRWATVSMCRHNRAALYHVRHHALYAAIGQPDSRYRRPMSAQLAIERLMLLDGVLASPELMWLGDEAEKVAFFQLMAPSLPRERLPHVTTGTGDDTRLRLFPEQLPIGVSTAGRTVFLYLATSVFTAPYRAFLQRHSDLFRSLPGWTLRVLAPPWPSGLAEDYERVAREELTTRFSPRALEAAKWYFEESRKTENHRARARSDPRFAEAQYAFGGSRCRELYRRWLTDGDSVFELVTSRSIEEALARGTATIESHVLSHSYRHLSPPGYQRRSRGPGVEEGDRPLAPPQPPSPMSRWLKHRVASDTRRDWYRLVRHEQHPRPATTCDDQLAH
jgi:hypothetical protein